MSDHVHDLASVREATDRLLSAVGTLDNAALAEPSRLPGWTRGHVLAHLARNADAIVNVFGGRPMYASAEARDADIERDAPRDLREHLDDLRTSAAGFERAAEAQTDWTRTVELRNGIKDSVGRLPFRRWVEVDLHHVDLGIGYDLEDLPPEFVTREIEFLAERFAGHPDMPSTGLKADDGRVWTTGGGSGTGPVGVAGSPAELLGWLCGRRDGSALTVEGGPLPVVPPL